MTVPNKCAEEYCGCSVHSWHPGKEKSYGIEYCKLHSAASDLRIACGRMEMQMRIYRHALKLKKRSEAEQAGRTARASATAGPLVD